MAVSKESLYYAQSGIEWLIFAPKINILKLDFLIIPDDRHEKVRKMAVLVFYHARNGVNKPFLGPN